MELTSEKSCCSAGNNQVDEQAGITFVEVMACPNGCIGGGGQPPASNARKAERFQAIFKEDERLELKIPQQNPALKYVYDVLMNGRAHELLHIHYPLHGDHHE